MKHLENDAHLLARLLDGQPAEIRDLKTTVGRLMAQGMISANGCGPRAALDAALEQMEPAEAAAWRTAIAAADPLGQAPDDTENASWPQMPDAGYSGVAGDFVRLVLPTTEADGPALLLQFLAAFGSVAGRNPHVRIGAKRHGTNLFVAVVGRTAKARKGTAWSEVSAVLSAVAPEWTNSRVTRGLTSGEGLIHECRDPTFRREPVFEGKGREKQVVDYTQVETDTGVTDKRLLVVEEELAQVLRVMARDGSTLSPILRQAWDGGDLRVMAKSCGERATGSHVSVIGHVTEGELSRYLSSTEASNGFSNRWLWCCSRRSKLIPLPTPLPAEKYTPLIRKLHDAIEHAKTTDECTLDDNAKLLWCRSYPELTADRPGLLGDVTTRGEALVRRLSLIYALLDCSSVVRDKHLLSAYAVWDYCLRSAQTLFGDSSGDRIADRILNELRNKPAGLSRTDIRDLFDKHQSSERIEHSLRSLETAGLARKETFQTGGRPTEKWFATSCDISDKSDESRVEGG